MSLIVTIHILYKKPSNGFSSEKKFLEQEKSFKNFEKQTLPYLFQKFHKSFLVK